MKGLRILARIIVRHRLAHPELYANGVSSVNGASPAAGGGVVDGEKTTGKEKRG